MAQLKISLLDGSILLHNAVLASKDKEIGWGDPRFSLATWKWSLAGEFTVHADKLAIGVWAARMLNEKGEFYHPEGLTFEQFLSRIVPAGYEFDETYGEFNKIGEE